MLLMSYNATLELVLLLLRGQIKLINIDFKPWGTYYLRYIYFNLFDNTYVRYLTSIHFLWNPLQLAETVTKKIFNTETTANNLGKT